MKIVNDNLIKKWEALKLKAYLPTPNDVWTIGWGHTHTTKQGMVITLEEAQALFERDTAWVEAAMARHIKVSLSQHQYDAIASWIFNVGERAFTRSTLLKKLNAGDFAAVANEFPRWNKQNGKVLRGLVRRRKEEQEYFLGRGEEFNKFSGAKPKLVSPVEAVGGVVGGLIVGGAYTLPEVPSGLVAGLTVAAVALLVAFVGYKLYKKRKGA
jgi:lysozyme